MKVLIRTAACALVAGLLVCGVFAGTRYIKHKKTIEAVQKAIERQEAAANALKTGTDPEKNEPSDTDIYNVSGAADSAMPSVVSIGVKSVSYSYDFFGRTVPYENSGSASGIIAAQNYGEILIVTNNHVVEGASSVEITFIDGEKVPASVKGTEESEDLAVVSVKLSDIKDETLSKIRVATFGSSDDLMLGEMVIAIGNALGYGQSVTVGHVSAKNREVDMEDFTLSLIQTDVAINPGNSGGALLNTRGEVVGINNAKIASADVEGICYAIPISTAIPIIDDLMNRQVLPVGQQAYLGISGQIITAENAELYNMPRGVYITEVKEGSPAETYGLKVGYIITKINGRAVTSQEGYEKIISYTRGGSEGKITIKKRVEGNYVEETKDVVFGTKSDN